ncbi:hypothetical protein D9M68_877330 [compost metagenome]
MKMLSSFDRLLLASPGVRSRTAVHDPMSDQPMSAGITATWPDFSIRAWSMEMDGTWAYSASGISSPCPLPPVWPRMAA